MPDQRALNRAYKATDFVVQIKCTASSVAFSLRNDGEAAEILSVNEFRRATSRKTLSSERRRKATKRGQGSRRGTKAAPFSGVLHLLTLVSGTKVLH